MLEIISIILSAAIGGVVTWLGKTLSTFVKEQRQVNHANMLANRSMQRDVLYRYYRHVVEQGLSITPEEFSHIKNCYEAYHENGGNGTGTHMWNKIQECAVIDTGRN